MPQDRIRNRKDIGRVEFLIDKLMAARALSSCCAAQEAMLETGNRLDMEERERDPNPSKTGAA
ncbi:MAG: hypothetical protein JNM20_20180 [Rhizobiales bacterium]|nr:hypothetical protein [Hyphomicrobiales bacterium]